jgi:hypothetical protein
MNKNFAKLANSATTIMVDGMSDEECIKMFVETFGILIVNEILQVCEENPEWTTAMLGEHIKEFFKIKEKKNASKRHRGKTKL